MFLDYVADIRNAISVFNFKGKGSQKYMRSLLSKFKFLRKEANERLLQSANPMFIEEMLQDLKPGKPILLHYLKSSIDEITETASQETIRMQEIKKTSNIAEAMLQTFGEQYGDDGKISYLLSEASSIIAKTYIECDRYSGYGITNNTKGWRQLVYEYNWYVKRLPKACWPMAIKFGN